MQRRAELFPCHEPSFRSRRYSANDRLTSGRLEVALRVDLEKERLNRGLSLSGMAAEIGIARNTLKSAAAGDPIHPASALKIAEFFGKKVTDIWPIEDTEAAAA